MRLIHPIILALLVLGGAVYYWLLIDAGPDGIAPRPLDLARMRAQAARLAGPRPVAVEFAVVASDRLPGTLLIAGGGLRPERVGTLAFRLVTPGGDTIVDTGMNASQANVTGYGRFDAAAQATVERWMVSAARIVVTGEQIDHLGGLIASPAYATVSSKAVLTPRQAEVLGQMRPRILGERPTLVASEDYAAVAPGVVLIRTPGHTPGSAMVYVALANGREYLFAGDTAPMRRNVAWQRPRSRLLSELRGNEDRAAVIGWIKALHALEQQAPRIFQVYSHDLYWLREATDGPKLVNGGRPGPDGPDTDANDAGNAR